MCVHSAYLISPGRIRGVHRDNVPPGADVLMTTMYDGLLSVTQFAPVSIALPSRSAIANVTLSWVSGEHRRFSRRLAGYGYLELTAQIRSAGRTNHLFVGFTDA